jgi:DNA invertase Pin-like site-specific DNA recombinase
MNWTKRPPPRCQGSESCSLEHIYAALAEKERAMIRFAPRRRWREKAKGARLGNPRLGEVRGKGVESLKEDR